MCSACVAELWGEYEGLNYAKQFGVTLMELNIDSLTIMQVIKNGVSRKKIRFALVRNIQLLMDLHWKVRVVHTYRESNMHSKF